MKTEDEIRARISSLDEIRHLVLGGNERLDAYRDALSWVVGVKK